MSETPKKPPIGLIPEFIFEEDRQYERINQIVEAIHRYSKEGMPVPTEWVNELYKRIDNHRSTLITGRKEPQ